MNFITHLFDTSDFPARWTCGQWTSGHGWLHILSDLGIWSAYLAIPCVLLFFFLRRKDLPFSKVFVLFGAFILLCGTTHLMEAIIFWWPAYRLAGVLKFLTAIVSWATVFALIPIVPKVLAMRSPEELEREIAARKQAEEGLQRANTELERRVEERSAELKQALIEIGNDREWLRTTLASIGDAVITTDTEGRVTNLNPIAETLTGWTHAESVGQPLDVVFRIVNEETLQPVLNPATRALKEGVIVGLANHTILIAKDNTQRPIDDSAAPIRHTDGVVVGCVLVFRDISERSRQEAELKERERQFRTLAESIPQMAWMANADGDIFWYNRRWYEYTGTTLEQTEGWGWQSVLDPDELPKVLDRWKASIATGTPFDMTFPIKGRDGQFRPFLTRIEPVKDDEGRVVRWFGTNTDITERKRAEEALKVSDERYRAATSVVSDLIWTNNVDGLMEGEQPGWQEFTGQTREEYQGYGWAKAVHPDDAQPTIEAWTRAVAEKTTFLFEHRLRRHDGQWRHCSIRAVPILNDAGRIREWVGVHTDITERKRDEEKLRQLAADLSEADLRKDEFLATLAHELRNPLAPIRNGLQLMKLAGGHEATFEQARTMMERQLTQMVRLVDDLMDVSRISRGKIALRKERVPLAAVLKSALETSQPLIEQMGHELTVTLPEETIFVDADITRLAQVFLNLLNNAAKYSNPGGHIRLTVERQANDVVVTVKDTGIGIAADQLPRIFEMFTQVDKSLEKSQGGLGIGLTLVKRLVEKHSGSVEAKSDGPGKGSVFVVRLPVLIEATKPQESGRDEELPVKTSLRILVVDDNRDGADTLSMMLMAMGNEIRTAYDGQEAVDIAEDFRPQVVLLDIGLPKLNGYEACRRIREQPWGKYVILIAVTGWGQDNDRRRAQDAGFDHHMVKPVDPQAMMTMLAGLDVGHENELTKRGT